MAAYKLYFFSKPWFSHLWTWDNKTWLWGTMFMLHSYPLGVHLLNIVFYISFPPHSQLLCVSAYNRKQRTARRLLTRLFFFCLWVGGDRVPWKIHSPRKCPGNVWRQKALEAQIPYVLSVEHTLYSKIPMQRRCKQLSIHVSAIAPFLGSLTSLESFL